MVSWARLQPRAPTHRRHPAVHKRADVLIEDEDDVPLEYEDGGEAEGKGHPRSKKDGGRSKKKHKKKKKRQREAESKASSGSESEDEKGTADAIIEAGASGLRHGAHPMTTATR